MANRPFTGDSRRLVTGHSDSTALVWDITVTGRASGIDAEKLSLLQLAKHWEDLAADDLFLANKAHWELMDRPAQTAAFLKDRKKPVQLAKEADVLTPVVELGGGFAERGAADKRLRAMGDAAVPHLSAALKIELKPEQSLRIEAILSSIASSIPADENLRQIVAIGILERIASAETAS